MSCLDHWSRARPDRTAIVADGHGTSWAQLRASVSSQRDLLVERGLRPGDTVAIMGTNCRAWCVVALAVLDLGATILPVNPRTSRPELGYVLESSGAAGIVVDAASASTAMSTVEAMARAPQVLALGDRSEVLRPGVGPDPVAHGHEAAAVVAYTSGTTGRPKGVELTHANLVVGSWFLSREDRAPHDVRILLVQPLSYTSGLISTFLASICNGWTLVIERSFDAERTLTVLEEQRVTTFRSVPLLWREIAEVGRFVDADLSALRTAHVGGAPVPEELLATWQDKGVDLCQGYGLTETCGAVTFCPPDRAAQDRRKVGSGGPHCDIEVRLGNGEVAPIDEVGEIHVRGPSVTRGYRGDPRATAETIVGGWLRTGDLATRDARGSLQIVGRSKDLIISGGINVYPAEIEAFIATIDGVDEVAVVAVPHPRFGEAPAAVVRASSGLAAEDIVQRCRAGLGSYKVPCEVVVTGRPLPRTASGKLLKQSLRERYFAADVATRA